MMGVRLLCVTVVAISLAGGGVPCAFAQAGEPSSQPLVLAKNDKAKGGGELPGVMPDRELESKKRVDKAKGPKRKGKGLDRAAMNSVRNAYKFLEQGKPEKALQELEKARRKAPDNYWVNYYSAGAYHQLRDYDRARRYWRAAEVGAETQEQRSRIRTAQSYTEFVSGASDQARASLKVAVDLDGRNTRARQLLAEVTSGGAPGQPQAGARLELGEVNSFMGYFMVPMD